jgi:hypothetical protein
MTHLLWSASLPFGPQPTSDDSIPMFCLLCHHGSSQAPTQPRRRRRRQAAAHVRAQRGARLCRALQVGSRRGHLSGEAAEAVMEARNGWGMSYSYLAGSARRHGGTLVLRPHKQVRGRCGEAPHQCCPLHLFATTRGRGQATGLLDGCAGRL